MWSCTKVVQVIGDRFDVRIGVWIEVLTSLTLIATAGNHVIQVWNNTGRHESVAVIIEVNSPRVARPFSKDFEFVPQRMVAPHPGVDRYADSVSGAAGLPTFECVKTPWQPYNQPSVVPS